MTKKPDLEEILKTISNRRKKISISDWPLFGQNPQQTRFVNGKMDSRNLRLAWRYSASDIDVFREPVCTGNKLVLINCINTKKDENNREIKTYQTNVIEDGQNKSKHKEISMYPHPYQNILHNDNIITCTGIDLIASDIDQRNEKWKRTRKFMGTCITVSLDTLFASGGGGVYAYKADNGESKWFSKIEESANMHAKIPPAVLDDMIYTAFTRQNNKVKYHDLLSAKVIALDANNGSTVWENKLVGSHLHAILASKDTIYAKSMKVKTVGNLKEKYYGSRWGYKTILQAFDARTGRQKWKFQTRYDFSGDNMPAGLGATEDSIVMTQGPFVYVFDKKDIESRSLSLRSLVSPLRPKWEFQMHRPGTAPVVHNDSLFVCSAYGNAQDEAVLYVLDMQDGNLLDNKCLETKEGESWVFANPIIANNTVYVHDKNYLHAYK